MNDFNLQKELLLKIVRTKVQGVHLTVMGGAATDTLLGRTCNDIDIFVPRFIADTVSNEFHSLLSRWGVQLDDLDGQEVQFIEPKYGDSTLFIDVQGQYRTSPVKIQFIAVEMYTDEAMYHGQEFFIEDTFSSFGVSTNCSAVFLTKYHQLGVYSLGVGVLGGRFILHKMLYRDGAENLLAKSVDKYIKYCTRGFEKLRDGVSIQTTGLRSLVSYVNGNLVSTGESLHSMINHEEYVDAPEEIDHTVSNNSSAATPPPAPTAGDLSSLWADIDVRAGGTRPRPRFGVSTSRAAQELQSARVESSRTVQEVRATARPRTAFDSLIESMARGTPSVPAPRSPDEF